MYEGGNGCGSADMAKLTDRTVKTAAAGRHMDGTVRGLSLLVKPTGGRSWVLRFQHKGQRRDMGLGPFPEVSLAEARKTALEHRRALKVEKVDPLVARRMAVAEAARAAAQVLTFKAAADALIETKRSGWRNAKHAWQWENTLQMLAYPMLGDLDVQAIDTAAVIGVLKPIWTTKTETASRLRRRIEAVLDYAKAMGRRTGENPARWKGHLDHLLAAPGKIKQAEHHAALDWREAPAFMADLAAREGIGAKALAFAILAAARSGEVRGMTWGEVDDDASVWTIPGSRMKAGKEHRVPLTPAARTLLGPRGRDNALVFPSPKAATKPLSDMTLMVTLRRMGRGDITAHGFRSTFRDWAGETTNHAREVAEAALAHGLKDKAGAAYARGDLFTKRRRLMEDWAAFLSRPVAQPIRIDTNVARAENLNARL
jgi:integrase